MRPLTLGRGGADIVFMRTWYPLLPPKLYNPVMSLLVPESKAWTAMRTLGQVCARWFIFGDNDAVPPFGVGVVVVIIIATRVLPLTRRLLRGGAQLRHDLGVPLRQNRDSEYRAIERAPRRFNALKIPKSIEANLPFASRPTDERKLGRPTLATRRAVVMEPEVRLR